MNANIDLDKLQKYALNTWLFKQGEMVSLVIHLGHRLGLYEAMDGAGMLTAEELSGSTGCHERWILEWLRCNAAAGLIETSDGINFRLEPEGAAVLAQSDKPTYAAAVFANLKPIEGVKNIKIKTAEEMYNNVLESLPVDVAIFSAAVADWKIKNIENKKLKKVDSLNLSLEKNIDILKNISNHNALRPKMVIGFAAETNDLEKNSKIKLMNKNCDWIIANDVSNPSIGFGSDENEISIFFKNQKMEKIKRNNKSFIANEIVKRIVSNLN